MSGPQAMASQARQLAAAVRRLSPDWRHPERYFERRDEIERELRQLARQLEHGNG